MQQSIVKRLNEKLGDKKVKTDKGTLDERRHDYSVVFQLDDMQGRQAPRPACVVQPAGTLDVVKVVNLCRQSGTVIIPFGLGSGVVSGVNAAAAAVLLDMSNMKKIRAIDQHNLMATFEAGVRGSDAEAAVNKRGLMLGHYPQSMDISSVGGWVATRACGQFSSAYGAIEDLVMGLEVVLPNGQVLETRLTPRAAAGPDLKHIFLGSEGTLGIITAVTFSLHYKPEKQDYSAFYVPAMEKGFETQRYLIQSGWTPPVMRQYDASEVKRLFPEYARGEDCLIILVHEGPAVRTAAEMAECAEIAADTGCETAPKEIVLKWLEERNHVPTFESFLKEGIIVDTVEIAAVWKKIAAIYKNAITALNGVENILNASAHSSHCYRSGLNLYFTFAAMPGDPKNMAAVYEDCWRRIMEATVKEGGGISHHHGIGRVRRPWMRDEVGPAGVALLKDLKKILDPDNIMNPGVLIPD
jgi:alkyldihydroxyacetonephosphate synthase